LVGFAMGLGVDWDFGVGAGESIPHGLKPILG